MSSLSTYNRKKHLNSPELTVTKCLPLNLRQSQTKSSLDLDIIGRPGKGLHSVQRTPSLSKLLMHFSVLSEKLGESDDFKPAMVELQNIKEDQLVKESIPSNHYTKGILMNNHQLLYKTFKADARLVRSILENSGFFYTDSHYWNVLWAGCAPQDYMYEDLNQYQKINHFPSSNEITRKDKMCVNIMNMQEKYGKENFDFIPETYVLPTSYSYFYSRFISEKNCTWIVKPSCSSQGRGIFLVNSIHDVPLDESCIVSKYIQDPYLINGLKFDMRIYVLVTSFEPLRIYIYEEGLTRFASEKYEPGIRENRFIHLTNYSVNKKNENFIQNTNAKDDGVGHKWSLSALMKYFAEKGVDTDSLWVKIYDLIIKSILSIENPVIEAIKRLGLHRNNCFDLFGFDVILDSNLKPWLLEVNLSPSLAVDSPLDFFIKSNLISDTFNIIGIRVKHSRKATLFKTCTKLVAGKLKKSPYLVPSFKKKENSKLKLQEIIRETLEEYNRKAGFLRIYPCPGGEFYEKFFTIPKNVNKILNSLLFNENCNLSILENHSPVRPPPLSKKEIQNNSFDSAIESKKIKYTDPKLVLNGDDLLVEYLRRIIKSLNNIDEEALTSEIKTTFENFTMNSAWKISDLPEKTIKKKLENRIQEMMARKQSMGNRIPSRNTQIIKSKKNIVLSEFSDEEITQMLNGCNKNISLTLINELLKGKGILIKLKEFCEENLENTRKKTLIHENRTQSLPKRPYTSLKIKYVF